MVTYAGHMTNEISQHRAWNRKSGVVNKVVLQVARSSGHLNLQWKNTKTSNQNLLCAIWKS